MTTSTPTAADHRAAGIEKMARAARGTHHWTVPWDQLPQWYKDEVKEEMTAALAAWEAHERQHTEKPHVKEGGK